MMIDCRTTLRGCAILIATFVSACATEDDIVVANLDGLQRGWNTIAPGGDTICSDGSPYQFFARPGDPEKLLVYFQGGGSCWNARTCDPDLEPTPYTVNLEGMDPARARGIFEFDRADNPFRDHSVVVAPYCSADVHLGDRIVEYESPTVDEHDGHRFSINYKGLVNAQAVLDWTFERFFAPQSIFVTGSSAGSIPSPYYAMLVADQYPNATVAQLGDGSGGYRRDGTDVAPEQEWGTLERLRELPEFADLGAGEFTFERLYTSAADRVPRIMFAAFDHAEDAVQKRFLELAGIRGGGLLPRILANQADIRQSVANFRSYIAGGDAHTILARPEFYTQHVGGLSVRDWVAELAAHRPVADVRCMSCDFGEFLDAP